MLITIALKLATGFIGLVIVIRLIGKKALSDLTPLDIIYSIVLGGILEEAVYDDRIHFWHILFALSIWGVLVYISQTLLQRSDRFTRHMKGYASVLIYEGQLNIKEIEKNHIEMEQLRSLLREKDCFSLKQVQYAVMETNGEVTLIKNEEVPEVFTYLMVDEGVMEDRSLETVGKDKKWLQKELFEQGYTDVNKLIYVEWSEEEGFYCKTYEECLQKTINMDG